MIGRLGLTALPVALVGLAASVPGGAVDSGPRAGSLAARTKTHRAAADTVVVTMTNRLTFEDDTVRIARGATVVWRNTSDLVHTVTADSELAVNPDDVHLPDGAKPFDSGPLAPGESFPHTFDVPGVYKYFCVPHEAAGMLGVVLAS